MAVLRFVRHWRWLEEEIVERSTHLITAYQFRHTVHTHLYTHTHNKITNNFLTSAHISGAHSQKCADTHARSEDDFAASAWKVNRDVLFRVTNMSTLILRMQPSHPSKELEAQNLSPPTPPTHTLN